MVNFPSTLDNSTTQQRRPSNPTWPTTPSHPMVTPSMPMLKTPASGKASRSRGAGLRKSRASPYASPGKVKVLHPDGCATPMELFIPKKYKEAAEAASATSSTRGINELARPRLPGSRPLIFPNTPKSREPSRTLVAPPMQGTPPTVIWRQPVDPTLPTVQLLRVLKKCWDDDCEKESSWTITNGLLNGRNEERDRSRMWDEISRAVRNAWPELNTWIMQNTPEDDDNVWFSFEATIQYGDEACMSDPHLAAKDSSLEKKGFYMTPNTYDTACDLIPKCSTDLVCLIDRGLNPFFAIYACADRGIPLPDKFNRQLLWKHLDAILRAKCWRALGSGRAKAQHNTSTDPETIPSHPSNFSRREDDPEGIMRCLLNLSQAQVPVHEIQIAIKDYQWIVKAQVGTVWYRAGDLYDDDLACFVVIDVLTRLLPSCRDGILEIQTNDLRLLWGVHGPRSGAWWVVWAACEEYEVQLRAKWSESVKLDPCRPVDPTEATKVPPREPAVVDTILDNFERLNSRAAYQFMQAHLRP